MDLATAVKLAWPWLLIRLADCNLFARARGMLRRGMHMAYISEDKLLPMVWDFAEAKSVSSRRRSNWMALLNGSVKVL